jgi:transcriptional regulator with XRE-family HTH domain
MNLFQFPFCQNNEVVSTASAGERLRARRMELGLTLLTVATSAGVSVPYVANLEKGRGNPTLDVIVALAEALGLSPATLLEDDEPDELDEPMDKTLVGLPPSLVEYAQGKLLAQPTERLAGYLGISAQEARSSALRGMAAAPRPASRVLSRQDCRRLLDVYTLIVLDPTDG